MLLKTRFKTFVFLPALLFLSACGSKDDSKGEKQKGFVPAIEGYVVHPQHAEEDLSVSGTVSAWDEVTLMPEIAGRITQLNLPEGQHVSKGDLLVKLYDGDLKAQLAKLTVQLQTATTTASRDSELVKVNGISKQDYDNAVTQVNSLKADIEGVNAQITKTEIRAPFDGTIGLRNVSEGAFVNPGTVLATIRTEQQLKLDFSVPEAEAALIVKDMPVKFTVSGDTSLFTANVFATEEGVDPATRDVRIRAKITDHSSKLLPGASATVMLALGARDNALMVPTEAIIPQDRYKSVIICRKGKAQFNKVITGVRTPSLIEIVSGIGAGDTIVTTGIQFIRNGSPLKFSAVK